eukprot:CAMPEP_0117553910 /NCGR_PEP_ID=MMETSP0784-20121206/50476_1 /TAXON_ID=39447 /ORGANISM="" /LENGTH=478 /DNA_ID=CAMNT_0005351047 /DNA_START=17 /DNA_END=1453 /DNA_ORIENTATION=-
MNKMTPRQATEHTALLSSLSDSEIELDEVLQRIGTGRFQVCVLVLCGLGFAAAAFEIFVVGFVFVELRDEWLLSEYELATIPTFIGVGTVLGSTLWGVAADLYGRQLIFMTTSAFVAVFGIFSAFSKSVVWLTLHRFLVAVGFGGNVAVDFALFVEFLPTESRGTMLFCLQAFWPVGQVATCLIAWLIIPRYGWRAFLAACAIPSIVTASFRPCIPETPRWLLLQGYTEEATEVCRKMAIWNGKRPDEVGLTSHRKLCIRQKTREQDSMWVLLHSMSIWKHPLAATAIGATLVEAALFAGGYAQETILPTLLEAKGMQNDDLYETMLLSSVAQFPGVLLAGMIGVYSGRLLPMKSFLFILALCLIGFTFASSRVSIMTVTCFGSMSLGAGWALTQTYIPEVFPTELRASAVGFAQAVASLVTAPFPMGIAYVLTNYGTSLATIVAAGTCALGGLGAVAFLHIETYGRDLPDTVDYVSD